MDNFLAQKANCWKFYHEEYEVSYKVPTYEDHTYGIDYMDMKNQYVRVTRNDLVTIDTATGIDLDAIGRLYGITRNGESETQSTDTPKAIVCECGKEKHGFASHSNWCEMKEKV